MDNLLIKKYAEVIVKIGANVQEGQVVCVNAPVEAKELIREIVASCYSVGAKYVNVKWIDPYCNRQHYLGASVETLSEIKDHDLAFYKYLIANNACNISITSSVPGIFNGVDPQKIKAVSTASAKAFKFYQEHFMNNFSQWVVAGYPNPAWAKEVFPDLNESVGMEKLYEAILKASRVSLDNDPVAEWVKHNQEIKRHNKILNDYNFTKLHFKNSLGTDLVVGLVENHIWAGGRETTSNPHTGDQQVEFNPNIPTEENFTMPHNQKTFGKVVSTKPLDYQGKLIKDFVLEFDQGKVVSFSAKENEDALKSLIEFDQGSCRLGEVALISHESPISMMNILFYNTLFDENASCHLALGAAYGATNLKGALDMNKEELEAAGCNSSSTHVDFMFGSADMEVTGYTHDNQAVIIFKDGNFVI